MAYITPFTTPDNTVRRCLFIPDEPLWLAAVSGALTELLYAYNWEDVDGITAEQAAERAREMIDRYYTGECEDMIGEVVAFARDGSLPDDFLEMDGSTYSFDDYPEFSGYCPSFWIIPATNNFQLPDMVDRSVIGVGGEVTDVGDTGGAATVTLTTSQIPSHTHAPQSGSFAVVGVGGANGATSPFNNAVSSVGATAATGGGGSHSNMPPFVGLKWGVRVK